VSLYRGDFLEGLWVQEAPFEAWLQTERERLRETIIEALARLVSHHTQAGNVTRAVQCALRLVSLDPLQESVHRALMRLNVRQGRRGAGALGCGGGAIRGARHDLLARAGVGRSPVTRSNHRQQIGVRAIARDSRLSLMRPPKPASRQCKELVLALVFVSAIAAVGVAGMLPPPRQGDVDDWLGPRLGCSSPLYAGFQTFATTLVRRWFDTTAAMSDDEDVRARARETCSAIRRNVCDALQVAYRSNSEERSPERQDQARVRPPAVVVFDRSACDHDAAARAWRSGAEDRHRCARGSRLERRCLRGVGSVKPPTAVFQSIGSPRVTQSA
jgi:hypothetical protein